VRCLLLISYFLSGLVFLMEDHIPAAHRYLFDEAVEIFIKLFSNFFYKVLTIRKLLFLFERCELLTVLLVFFFEMLDNFMKNFLLETCFIEFGNEYQIIYYIFVNFLFLLKLSVEDAMQPHKSLFMYFSLFLYLG